ncbi:MAG TPA: hypothetical protein VIV65_06970 [Gemmatimonadaceae bacterium]|jgi:hypothetical protein
MTKAVFVLLMICFAATVTAIAPTASAGACNPEGNMKWSAGYVGGNPSARLTVLDCYPKVGIWID